MEGSEVEKRPVIKLWCFTPRFTRYFSFSQVFHPQIYQVSTNLIFLIFILQTHKKLHLKFYTATNAKSICLASFIVFFRIILFYGQERKIATTEKWAKTRRLAKNFVVQSTNHPWSRLEIVLLNLSKKFLYIIPYFAEESGIYVEGAVKYLSNTRYK